jgi:hypothetical protein
MVIEGQTQTQGLQVDPSMSLVLDILGLDRRGSNANIVVQEIDMPPAQLLG